MEHWAAGALPLPLPSPESLILIARQLRRLTAYYQDEIRRTTESLSTDLHRLSDELVRSAPNPAAQTTSPAQGPVIPQRLPFTEELKARVSPAVLLSLEQGASG